MKKYQNVRFFMTFFIDIVDLKKVKIFEKDTAIFW